MTSAPSPSFIPYIPDIRDIRDAQLGNTLEIGNLDAWRWRAEQILIRARGDCDDFRARTAAAYIFDILGQRLTPHNNMVKHAKAVTGFNNQLTLIRDDRLPVHIGGERTSATIFPSALIKHPYDFLRKLRPMSEGGIPLSPLRPELYRDPELIRSLAVDALKLTITGDIWDPQISASALRQGLSLDLNPNEPISFGTLIDRYDDDAELGEKQKLVAQYLVSVRTQPHTDIDSSLGMVNIIGQSVEQISALS